VWSEVRAADPVLAWVRGVIKDIAKDVLDIGGLRVSRARENL
jgi:hypothetical protein